jgi:hypothetical protein
MNFLGLLRQLGARHLIAANRPCIPAPRGAVPDWSARLADIRPAGIAAIDRTEKGLHIELSDLACWAEWSAADSHDRMGRDRLESHRDATVWIS